MRGSLFAYRACSLVRVFAPRDPHSVVHPARRRACAPCLVAEVIGHVMQSGRREDFTFGLDLILDALERNLGGGRSGGHVP